MIGNVKKVFWLLSLVLCACATLLPDSYWVDRTELQQAVAKKFPVERANGLVRVVLTQPEMTLLPEQNRLRLSCRFAANTVLGGKMQGALSASAGLGYVQTKRAVVLQGAQLDALTVDGDKNLAETLRPIMNIVLDSALRDYPVREFKAEELTVAGVALDIRSIVVEPSGVRIGLQPERTHP